MADLVVTAANVVLVSGATVQGTIGAGETITQGQAVYLDGATNTWKRAKADTAAHAACGGIALTGGSATQPITVQINGTINLGATLVAGAVYMVSSAVAGSIAPNADIGAAAYVSVIGIASTTANLVMGIVASGVAHG